MSLLARTPRTCFALSVDADEHVRGGASPQRPPAPLGPRYRFRDGIWPVICDQMGWANNFAASKALGVSDTTITRGQEGVPGERLMAAVMAALPRTWKFEHVFELATDDDPVAEAGSPFQTSGSRNPQRTSGDTLAAEPASAGNTRTSRRRSA